jgi:hypothetical protein
MIETVWLVMLVQSDLQLQPSLFSRGHYIKETEKRRQKCRVLTYLRITE